MTPCSRCKKKHAGKVGYCKPCKRIYNRVWRNKNKQLIRFYKDEWRKNNRHRVKSHNINHRYGIESSEYKRMLKEQSYRCKICGGDIRGSKGRIDHSHKTKKVRGILCGGCNLSLGLMKENKRSIRRMVNYLS